MSSSAFILLFRGINVGGNKLVKMETLRKVLIEAGFANVASYIQSGNLVMTSDQSESAITDLVTTVFNQTFGFTSRVSIRSLAAWNRMVEENPFAEASEEGKRLHAVILDAEPPTSALKTLEALAETEQIVLAHGVLYLYTPDGLGRSKVAESLDKVLKVPLTARNWNTVLKLQSMAEALPTQ